MSSLRCLVVALMVTLAGCATSDRLADQPAPVISQATWRQVDSDIVAASRDATEQAASYAHDNMQRWMDLVYQRTDSAFIPWFSSYWTRQWLTMKVTWYQLNAGGEKEPVVDRLALYLQEQYRDRVLEPVAETIDPDLVMEQATRLYVRRLGERVRAIAPRYGVPLDQFDRRLQGIPAIALAPPANHSASLYQIVHAEPLDRLPAYMALVERIHNAPGGARGWAADAGISSVAKRTSESLTNELTTNGVASAVSAVVGRVAGAVISLGAAGVSALVRQNQRPEMEAQLRKNLNAAFDEEWLDLMRNPDSGVLAGVFHLSGQIEGSLDDSAALPVHYEPEPQGIAVPDAQPLRYGTDEEQAPYRLW